MTVKVYVTPISGSYVAWDNLLKDINDLTGRSPTHGIDASGLKLSKYARFIVALEEFHEQRIVEPIDAQKDANAVLSHLHFSFLIHGPLNLISKINEQTELSVVTAKGIKGRVAFVSGTLKQWKDAVIILCRIEQTRSVGNIVSGFFHKIGLRSVFADYTCKNTADGKFLLEHKR